MAGRSEVKTVGKGARDLEKRLKALEQWAGGAMIWIKSTSSYLQHLKEGRFEGVTPPKPPPPKDYP